MLVILARFLRFLKGTHFGKLPTESERSDQFSPGKFLKIIEHVSYSIRYCKISLLIYTGSSSLSNAGNFFVDSPCRGEDFVAGCPLGWASWGHLRLHRYDPVESLFTSYLYC